MVKITGSDFNREMNSYIEKRREISKFEVNRNKETQTKIHVEEEPEQTSKKTRSFFEIMSLLFRRRIPSSEEIKEKMDNNEEVEVIEDEMEDIENQEEELEIRKETLLKRLFRKLGFFDKETISEEEMEVIEREQVLIDEETKETIKLLHKWIEQLPPEKLQDFKSSPDFEKYKGLLKKLGLIKE